MYASSRARARALVALHSMAMARRSEFEVKQLSEAQRRFTGRAQQKQCPLDACMMSCSVVVTMAMDNAITALGSSSYFGCRARLGMAAPHA
jgi:hypothetical protein